MEPEGVLARSRALWNRKELLLQSDEVLAQILDRGSLEDWRALYRLLSSEGEGAAKLRERLRRIVEDVPLGTPHFWLAVLHDLGYPVDWTRKPRPATWEADI